MPDPNVNILSDVLNLEKILLEDASDANAAIAANYSAISSQLDDLNTNLDTSIDKDQKILADQSDVQNILNQEYQRLQSKQHSVTDALASRQRVSVLNENYRLRYAEYVKILIIFIVTLVIVLAITRFGEFLTFIPEYILNFIVIIVIFIAAISIYYIYMGIIFRDNIYFNELKLKDPTVTTTSPGQYVDTSGSGSLDLNFGTCIGSDCCDEGLYYDNTLDKCTTNTPMPTITKTPTPSQGFTTMELAYSPDSITNGKKPASKLITANTPYELKDYAIYN